MGNKASQFAQRARQIRQNRDQRVSNHRTRLQKELEALRLDARKVESILNSPVTEIVKMLNAGQTTSYELTLIFALRASTVGLENCWITEDNFDEAIKMARQCDEHRQRTRLANRTLDSDKGEGLPELFGVPVSIKDTFDMKGLPSSIGTVARYDWVQAEDGAIIQAIKKAGMIPFVKSNVPQLAMTFESENHVWGRALNPWNKDRSVGGSSGGEGALIAGRCSPLGLGSDLGGSIRIPAEFCGVYAFKPSSYRYSPKGHTYYEKSINGNINIPLTIGPLGKSTEDLATFIKIMCDENNYNKQTMDAYIKLQPFNVKMYRTLPNKMKIGYFDSLDIVPATAASKRAIHMVKAELEKLGHEFIRVAIPSVEDVIGEFYEYVAAEGNLKGYREILEGEDFINEYRTVSRVFGMPNWLIRCGSSVTSFIMQIVKKFKPRLGYVMSKSESKDAYEYLQLSYRHVTRKREFVDMWRKHDLDILICPGFGAQAVKHTFSEQTTLSACYTFIWNMLETPTGSMPITRVQPDEQVYHRAYEDSINEKLTESARGSAGMPVGIQVVGLPYEDEKVLGVMRLIEHVVPFYKQHTFPK